MYFYPTAAAALVCNTTLGSTHALAHNRNAVHSLFPNLLYLLVHAPLYLGFYRVDVFLQQPVQSAYDTITSTYRR